MDYIMSSEYIDTKYINLLSPKLDRFTVKSQMPFTANCRCPICGDSKKNRYKARGYVFTKKGGLFYKCHNCGYSASIGNFIKNVDPFLYDQYVLERYKTGGHIRQSHANVENIFSFSAPKFREKRLLDDLLDPIYNTKAETYLAERKVPKQRWDELYFISNIQNIEQLSAKYKDRIVGEESRLVIPFYDRDGKLVGVTCRALGDERLRYVTVRVNEDKPMIYNLDRVDFDKTVYVTEGPIDSMFLDNAVAVGNSDLKTIASEIPKEKVVLIFDNQPRNKELIKIMERAINDNYSLVIWPENIVEKDINEMVLAGLDVTDIISKHTFQNLELKLHFANWRKLN